MSLFDHSILKRLLTAYQHGNRLVLAFDYDGTLTPLVAHPDLASLDSALRAILARLAVLPRVTVAIISGRGLDNLIAMVGLNGLYYGGSCGLELDLRGARVIPAEAPQTQELFAVLRLALEARLCAYPGAWVDQKPFGFTLHYRQLASDQIEPLRAEVTALLEPHAPQLLILDGPLAIEILPAIERDKGTALRSIIAHSGTEPVVVLFAGDAANDKAALVVAAERGGIALGIGPESLQEATDHLPDPATLYKVLAMLAANLANAHPTGSITHH